MTNEELLSAIRGVVREEVNAGEQRMRTLVREEVNAGEQRMRILVREEVNAAVYASEQRTGERLDKMDGRLDKMDERLDKMDERLDRMDERLDKMDGRMNRLEGMVLPMNDHLRLLKAGQAELQAEFRNTYAFSMKLALDIEKITGILDLVTIRINDFEQAQHNLENKIEGNLKAIHRHMERVYDMIVRFTNDFNDAVRRTHARLDEHEKTSLDETHPQRSPF